MCDSTAPVWRYDSLKFQSQRSHSGTTVLTRWLISVMQLHGYQSKKPMWQGATCRNYSLNPLGNTENKDPMTSRLIQLILRGYNSRIFGLAPNLVEDVEDSFAFDLLVKTCQWKMLKFCWNLLFLSHPSTKEFSPYSKLFQLLQGLVFIDFSPHHWGYSLAKSLMTETPEFNCGNFAWRRIRRIFPRMARLSRSTMPVVIVEPLLVLYLGHHVIIHTNIQHDNMIYQTDINKQYSWWHTQIPNCKLEKLAKNHHDRVLSG